MPGDAPKTFVELVTAGGIVLRREKVYSWKALRETVRELREEIEHIPFNSWSISVRQEPSGGEPSC